MGCPNEAKKNTRQKIQMNNCVLRHRGCQRAAANGHCLLWLFLAFAIHTYCLACACGDDDDVDDDDEWALLRLLWLFLALAIHTYGVLRGKRLR